MLASDLDNDNNKRTIKDVLKELVLNPEKFTSAMAADGLRSIMRGEATDAQIGGFLTALRLGGIGWKPEIIAALAAEGHSKALVPVLNTDTISRKELGMVVDIVGTGGDGWSTFNISTTSSLVVATAADLRVAKYGSRASTSNSGSADLLEAMGCSLSAVKPSDVAELLYKNKFCFLFANTYHPGMRHLSNTRRELGFPTPFNILGPLTNPVVPDRAVVGVYSKSLGRTMAEALKILGRRNYAVVCGDENLDEVSIAGISHVWHIRKNGNIDEYTVHPSDFGVPTHPLSAAAGSTLEDNKATLKRLLSNKLEDQDIPVRDFVLINAGFLLFVSGVVQSFKEGADLARQTLESGKVQDMLGCFASATQKLELR
ncbi:anthranilate phosphoribosyltransferase [Coemansia asiatica]|uniref:Anthranilate phosphoribosyltransferase n=1 Tax=Coemansia asiatica TaxID=1052880 RepID=A0A9W7XNA3_9FUNG|nr:anthranilate phosphoribosyltransferase [Coemansia asiatica]